MVDTRPNTRLLVRIGPTFTSLIFQMSFATTATTIVSGAIAERSDIIIACYLQLRLIIIFHSRFDFNAYCIFSLVNTIVYAVPAGWLWAERGFLYRLGVVDIAGNTTRDQIRNISLVKSKSLNAGSGGVHLVGGASALVSAWLVGPRLGRWQLTTAPPMGSPTNALIGLYMLWWGWLAFNAGSTFGVRDR